MLYLLAGPRRREILNYRMHADEGKIPEIDEHTQPIHPTEAPNAVATDKVHD